ncbi:unnamed protein product [Didymodactylos carnosus]|uniref:ubiquitinyl hydrolase 1 n=1 Tax=Didymodactylos carnosus TaxID=1234261 RepID=A0A8S2I7Z4_9BILA|nr:unnamed protein product [Didymodactylos carnosus]CAF3718946.1 unnamed protein product [Didymodactylos carnosus]
MKSSVRPSRTSATRQEPTSSYRSTTTRGNVNLLTSQIQSGSMNITRGTHTTKASPERIISNPINGRISKFDRPVTTTTLSAAQQNAIRRPSTDSVTMRTRLSSHDRTTTLCRTPHVIGAVIESSNDHPPTKAEAQSPTSASANPPPTISSIESKLMLGGLKGLANLGNTVHMYEWRTSNSNTKPLLLFCLMDNLESSLNLSSTSVMKGGLMREFVSFIKRMWSSAESHSIISPSQFKNQIARFAPRFTGYSEQDSQEFLRYLLQGLHEDVNRVQKKPTPIKIDEKAEEQMNEKDLAKLSWDRYLSFDNSTIVDIFVGQLKSTLECSHCGYQSITFDPFWDLSVPLPRVSKNKSSSTLQECIQLFMSREELDGNEKAMCAKCKQKRRCTKKFSIQKCPEILVLHLKRFSQSRGRTKLNTMVDFPITNLRLNDLTDVLSESYEGPDPIYSLFGVSNHSGTPYTGHYTAACKHPFQLKWHEFNDSSVYQLSQPSRIISPDAYVLFYERV